MPHTLSITPHNTLQSHFIKCFFINKRALKDSHFRVWLWQMRNFHKFYRFLLIIGAANGPLHADDKTPLQNKLAQADCYFDASLFDKSIVLYQGLLCELHENTMDRAHTRLQLAKAYYFLQNYEKTAAILNEIPCGNLNVQPAVHLLNAEGMLLKGLALGKMKHFSQASQVLKQLVPSAPLSIKQEVLLELGLCLFHQEEYAESEKYLEQVESPHLAPLAEIFLTRIAIARKSWEHCHRLTQSLKSKTFTYDFLPYAISFLEGEVLFHQGNWGEAKACFERGIASGNTERNDWNNDALSYLGWCHFHLAEDQKKPMTERKEHLDQCIEFFTTQCKGYPSDQSILALGQALLLKGSVFADPHSLAALDTLLSKETHFRTTQAKHHALLLRAEAALSYVDRRRFFRKLIHDSHQASPFYPNAWYLFGLNELDEGQRLAEEKKEAEARKHLTEASTALEKGFVLLFPNEKSLAAQALRQQIYAFYYQNTKEGMLRGLAIIGKLLNKYREDLFGLLEEPDEIYYLQGLLASQIADNAEGNTFNAIAENSLKHCIDSYPKGRFYEESLRLLGAFYFQQKMFEKAEHVYLILAQKSPPSLYAGDAWHWAANCREHLGNSQNKVQHYRKKVFEAFPQSTYADEAYFRFYSIKDYLLGDPEALRHLLDLENKFPRSPYRISALYLIGLDALHDRKSTDGKTIRSKDLEKALSSFQQAAAIYESSTVAEDKQEYFIAVRYRSLLEGAQLLLANASTWEQGEKILHKLYLEFETPGNEPATSVSKAQLHPGEECAFSLAQCYIQGKQDSTAERILSKMLEKYHAAKISRGYYLSRAWYEQGMIATRKERHAQALECLTQAEDAAKGRVLSTDELLDLWIQQSFCYQKLQQLEEAMLILSKVINYDAISSERLKAMFLRGEIYEQQGRLDLARRQLEALSKQGGPWSQKAKIKLEQNYAFQ